MGNHTQGKAFWFRKTDPQPPHNLRIAISRFHAYIGSHPPRRSALTRRHGPALILALLCAASSLAQSQPAPAVSQNNGTQITLGRSVVSLYGPWKFSIGDSPVDPTTHAPLWAQPTFDDSSWENVDLTPKNGAFDPIGGMGSYVPGWATRGHPGVAGYGWYRLRVRVASSSSEPLAVAGPTDVDDGYQLFANGHLLGSFGDFSHSRPTLYYAQPMTFPVQQVAKDSATLVLAFRCWMDPGTPLHTPEPGGMHSAPMIGDAATIDAQYHLNWLELIRGYIALPIDAVLYCLLAIVAFSLIVFDPSDRVYRWMGAVFVLTAVFDVTVALGALTQVTSALINLILSDVVERPLLFAGWIMVWWVWFGLHRPSWIPKAVAALSLATMVSIFLAEGMSLSVIHLIPAFHIVSLIARFLLLAIFLWIAVQGIRLHGFDGWIVLPAIILVGISHFSDELSVIGIRNIWFPFRIQLSLITLANLLLTAISGLLLFRRLLTSVRNQRRLALDVKQAQEVQQVILPEPRTVLAGLVVESEYRPALEVGGDFFQIIPNPADSSLLIVAGDVTGKGLKAGMLVALLVGAIRSTVESTTDPRAILEALNRRLLGRGDAHATCLALRIDADGACLVANAGHMPPYINGHPLPIDGSLPLGMASGIDFSSMEFRLAENDRLVLISDGIVEATDPNHQLLGFERTEQLLNSASSAADIASAAQSFGQEDDISVISVTRVAVPVSAVA
jgi:hypothetical protein